MDYESAFFDGVQEILLMSEQKNPRLLTWLMGLLGVPYKEMGIDPIAALQDFKNFTNNSLNRGPLRLQDVIKINHMILFQQQERCGLNNYDAATATTWSWDGSPMAHAVVAILGQEAAKMLGSDELSKGCKAIEWRALEMIIQIDNPALELLSDYAKLRATNLEQEFDVSATLRELDAAVAKPAPI